MHPFDQDRDRDRLFRRIVTGDFSLSRPEFGDVSKRARQLVGGLMDMSVGARISATAALKHRWMVEPEPAGAPAPELSMRSRLVDFTNSMDCEARTSPPWGLRTPTPLPASRPTRHHA